MTQQTQVKLDPFFYRLSGQTRSALLREDIECIEKLASLSEEELTDIRGIGQKRKDEIISFLEELNLPSKQAVSLEPADNRYFISRDLSEFIQNAREESNYWDRGVDYLRKDRVVSVQQEDEEYVFRVQGKKQYSVRLRLDEQDWDCECPVYRYWGPCKHVIAGALHIAEKERRKQLKKKEQKKSRISRLRNKLNSVDAPVRRSQNTVIHYLLTNDLEGQWRLVAHKGPETPTSQVRRLPRVQYEEIDNPSLPANGVDRTVLERLSLDYSRNSDLSSSTAPSPMGDVLHLLDDRRVWLQDENGEEHPITITSDPLSLKLNLSEREDEDRQRQDHDLRLKGVLENEEHTFRPDEVVTICERPIWVLNENTLYPVRGGSPVSKIMKEFQDGPINIPHREMNVFCGQVFPKLDTLEIDVEADPETFPRHQTQPEGRIYLSEEQKKLIIQLRVAYEGVEVTDKTGELVLVPDEDGRSFRMIERNESQEDHLRKRLEREGVRKASVFEDQTAYTPEGDPIAWLIEHLPELTADGFKVFGEENLKRYKRPMSPTASKVSVSSGIDWFNLDGSVEYGDEEVSMAELRETLQAGQKYVELSDGEYGKIPDDWVEAFSGCLDMAREDGDRLQMPEAAAPIADDLTEVADETTVDDGFHETLEKFEAFEEIEEVEPPEGFQGTLRPYQKAGVSWMMFLRDFGVGGILADDMGLGKTIQVLALFRKIQEKTGSYPSSLVVAPRSVITNWERETKRFIPGISVYTHHGMDRASDLEEWPDKDLAITTYGTMRRDIDWLKENDFDYVILDESQAIRNPDTKTSRAAKKIQAANRLCLSGTPVQNTTLDLWSQFEFLNPGYLGSRNRFEETFVRGIEADQAEQVTNQLRSLVDPFMLRRTKERVENELPPISQSILECPMEDEQRELYEQTRSAYHTALKEDMENKSSNEVRFKTLEGLTRLRQICCHPDLVGEDHGYSTKLEQFRRKAREVIQEGHRILVFSQFVEFLEQIENDVQEMDWEYEYLDGQTRNRQERVDRFQNNKDIPLFLISLKAGGEGLNLTGADYVFLMDPWWNPAVERQATDRTHRIGQSKRVFVYRFICPDTVEEKILELQKKKRTIANDVITPEADLFKNLSQDDITTLFS